MNNDITENGTARLYRTKNSPDYYWRDWVVLHIYDVCYNVVNAKQGVSCAVNYFINVKKLLPKVDAAVASGKIPDGFEPTDARIMRDLLALPDAERRDKVNASVRSELRKIIALNTEAQTRFIHEIGRLGFTDSWPQFSLRTLQLSFSGYWAACLLEFSGEELPFAVLEYFNDSRKRLAQTNVDDAHLYQDEDCLEDQPPILRVVQDKAEDDALRAWIHDCRLWLDWYKEANVPTKRTQQVNKKSGTSKKPSTPGAAQPKRAKTKVKPEADSTAAQPWLSDDFDDQDFEV